MGPTWNERIHGEVVDFLMREAELLDNKNFEQWLETLTRDVLYHVPIEPRRDRTEGFDLLSQGAWLSENRKSVEMRVKRLSTPGALAEEPPSRTRHFASNIRVAAGTAPAEVRALVYRPRGEFVHYDLFSGERWGKLRRADGNWKLARRDLLLDLSLVGA